MHFRLANEVGREWGTWLEEVLIGEGFDRRECVLEAAGLQQLR